MAEFQNLELGHGAVAVVDALGFREARKKHGVESLITSVRQARERMQTGAKLESEFGIADTTVAAFSDSIIVATRDATNTGRIQQSGLEPRRVERLAGSISTLVSDAALAAAPLAYRGCISVGQLTVVDDIFVGPAIDEAAELAEIALAAVVWLAPSAVATLKGQSFRSLVQWDVPLRGRGTLRTLVVNPFFAAVRLASDDAAILARIEEVEQALLRPFGTTTTLDVVLKRQHTEAFLAVARRCTIASMPEARIEHTALMDALSKGLLDDDDDENDGGNANG